MLVDNPLQQQQQQPYLSSFTDVSDIFHTELFANPSAVQGEALPSSPSSSSRASSPQSPFHRALQTPPQPMINKPTDFNLAASPSALSTSSYFGLFDDEHSLQASSSAKVLDPVSSFSMSMAGYNTLSSQAFDYTGLSTDFGLGMDVDPALSPHWFGTGSVGAGAFDQMFTNPTAAPSATSTSPSDFAITAPIGIDPQLVGTPATSFGGDEDNDAVDVEKLGDSDAPAMAAATSSTGVTKLSKAIKDTDNGADADVSSSDASSSRHSKSSSISARTKAGRKTSTAASSKPGNSAPEPEKEKEKEKLTLTITPLKVGGLGKARKGTVQSGGIVKKSTVASTLSSSLPLSASLATPALMAQNKENTLTPASGIMSSSATSFLPSSASSAKARASSDVSKQIDDDGDDELPPDWRPPPEVFAKMTSKEKRQLRNKISARNFRIRRKEYISTLEGDIAERDRLLDAIRSELGSKQSENLALRQEIAILKKALLDGRVAIPQSSLTNIAPAQSALNTDLYALPEESSAAPNPLANLPPPAPLPAQSAASILAQAQQQGPPQATTSTSSSSPLIMPNLQKDVSSSATADVSSTFWGGALLGSAAGAGANAAAANGFGPFGGVTTVHRVVLPEVSVGLGYAGFGGVGGMWGLSPRSGSKGSGSEGGSSPRNSASDDADDEDEGEDVELELDGTEEKGAENDGENRVAGDVKEERLTENMNPMLNAFGKDPLRAGPPFGLGTGVAGMGFDGFADGNLFTMKSMDAYRMHLWGKMAAQHHLSQQQLLFQQQQQQYQSQSHLTGHAANMRPSFFTSPASSLSGLLFSKHSAPYYVPTSPPSSPPPPYSPAPAALLGKDKEREREKARERERENVAVAAYATALASQTLLRKLGSAFWEAFSGSSSSSSLSAPAAGGQAHAFKPWDADKVRKVLEGKAVVRVVDVDVPAVSGSTGAPSSFSAMCGDKERKEKKCTCTEILEESMRSLSLGKKY